jgi:site-specific DNA-methyltransferase (adenine-specific)/adenine-specific DNA-methyltransferase
VLDPFCGGGTTGEAALALNRAFVGSDIDPGAIETTRKRLASATAALEQSDDSAMTVRAQIIAAEGDAESLGW